MLSGLFNGFGRFLAAELGILLRTPVRLSVASIDQQVYEEMLQQVPPMARVAILQSAELGGRIAAVLPPREATILTDLMLGGRGEAPEPVRSMGETEQLILERLFALWPEHLRTAFRSVAELDIAWDRLEGSLEFVQLASAQETIVRVRLGLEGLDVPMPIDLLLLHTGLQPLLARLHSATWSGGGHQAIHRARDLMRRVILDAPLPVTVGIEGLPIGLADLVTLTEGDVIPLGHPVDRPFTMFIGSRPLGRVHLGAVGSRVAVQFVRDDIRRPQEGPA